MQIKHLTESNYLINLNHFVVTLIIMTIQLSDHS